MKFVTFNLRLDNGLDGINCFSHRAGGILKKIESEKPDVIGFQECLPNQFDFLRRHLTDYMVVGNGRSVTYGDEHSCIAFLKDKYELMALDTMWLSPTPFTPGSRHAEQSSHPRIVTYVALRPYDGGAPFRVYNTHLDHVSELAMTLGAQSIVEMALSHLERLEMPLVIMGDMNAEPSSRPIRTFLDDPVLRLTDHTANIPVSFHDYGRIPGVKIDYILSRGMKATSETIAWDDVSDGIYLSDHYPLCAELDLEK